MRVLRSWLLLVVLLIPAGAHASDHNASLFVAPSYLLAQGTTSHLGGWHVSGEVTVKKPIKLSFVGDLSTHFFGSDGGRDLTQITFMVGPRWTLLSGRKGMPFVHAMALGAVQRSEGRRQVATTAGAFAVGAGLDFVPAARGKNGFRVQGDYIQPVATTPTADLKGSLRISVGWIYRFHDPHP